MIKDIIKTIDEIAMTDPDRTAYDYLGTTNTYGELKRRSDAYAAKIFDLHLPAKEPIMIWGGQTFEMIASFLGAVKAGHAYIPIDSGSNNERLLMIQEVSRAQTVIAVDPLPVKMAGVKVITPEEVPTVDFQPNPHYFAEDDDNYYIIFTSGTTGKPKGVQISHRNLLSFVNWELSAFNLPAHPSFLAQAPFSFDLSVMSLYPALTSGGKLVVLPRETTQNFGQLFKVLPQMQFNVWVSTPSFAEMCFLDPTFNGEHHPDLTHFLFCGEELSHKTAAALQQKFPQAHIFNTYGPTETTVAVTQVEITPDLLAKYDRLPIGYAKPDTEITIDTSKGEVNDQGEIIIQGPSVSKGYLHNPDKTKAVFFKNQNDENLSYRAGDLGFIKDDLLFYRGRIDFQIKFNGYRIELEEINFYLSKHPLVKYGVVAPKYTADHKVRQLVAVVVLNDGVKDQFSQAEIIKQLRESLEKNSMPYMIPQRFVFQDEMPISQNGKVDLKAVIKEVNQA
jgi:D-alanine--poly(phosphoribitol) ligase subunit 1